MLNLFKIIFHDVKVGEVWQRDDSYSPFEEDTRNCVTVLGVKDGYVMYKYFSDNLNLLKTEKMITFKSIFTKKSDLDTFQ